MKRASRLQKLWLSMKKRCRRLRQEAMLLRAPIGSAEREVGTSSLVINLLNIWGNFARSYYLSCMSECRCTGGHMVSVGMPGLTIHDAIGLAISIITPWNSFVPGTIPDRRREPTWHDPNTLLRIAASQAFSHRSDIVAAFSTGSRTFQDLPRFRNYFAHRNDDTLKVARNAAPLYGIPRALKPSEILMSTPLNASEALIIIMIDDIVFTAEYLCA